MASGKPPILTQGRINDDDISLLATGIQLWHIIRSTFWIACFRGHFYRQNTESGCFCDLSCLSFFPESVHRRQTTVSPTMETGSEWDALYAFVFEEHGLDDSNCCEIEGSTNADKRRADTKKMRANHESLLPIELRFEPSVKLKPQIYTTFDKVSDMFMIILQLLGGPVRMALSWIYFWKTQLFFIHVLTEAQNGMEIGCVVGYAIMHSHKLKRHRKHLEMSGFCYKQVFNCTHGKVDYIQNEEVRII